MTSDIKLLDLLKNNPNKGIEILIDEYSGLVYSIVNNYLSSNYSDEDIEECISDIFVQAYQSIDKINLNIGSIKGFLAVISKRKAIDLYRKNKNKNQIEISTDDLDIVNHKGLISDDNEVLNKLSKKETNELLIKSIDALGEPDKTIIIRKYFFRESSKEISKALNIKINTIDKRASRALIKLKNILGGII